MRTARIKPFDLVSVLFTLLVMLFCVLPMVLVFAVSITDEAAIQRNGSSFIPEKLSLSAYRMLFIGQDAVGRAYLISGVVTIGGTALAVVITGMAGYALANRNAQYRNGLALFFFVTMVFHPGLVPWYFVGPRVARLGRKFGFVTCSRPASRLSPGSRIQFRPS